MTPLQEIRKRKLEHYKEGKATIKRLGLEFLTELLRGKFDARKCDQACYALKVALHQVPDQLANRNLYLLAINCLDLALSNQRQEWDLRALNEMRLIQARNNSTIRI